jgi:predicted Zn-ribbon and HTH transcriptional regulator
MTAFRKDLLRLLSAQPRSIPSLARDHGLRRGDIIDDLQHAPRSAREAGHQVIGILARSPSCGFIFDEGKLLTE